MVISDVRKLSPLEIFLYWVRERHSIYLRRQAGLPRPWTDDEILRDNFFTNPYRENDRTTQWFRENVRDPLRDDPAVVLATVIFRWFNYIPTGEVLIGGSSNLLLEWNEAEAVARLHDAGGKVFTGAFMVNSPGGEPKLEAICRRVSNVWNRRKHLQLLAPSWSRMNEAHADLLRYDGLGGFMAYEIVCDLRYTRYLENATDKLRWSNPGPGAIRGLLRVLGREITTKNNSSSPPVPRDWEEQTRKLLATVQRELPDLPSFEMREIEHSLCETDKYIRALFGEGRLKRRYAGGAEPDRPARRPEPGTGAGGASEAAA